MKYELRTIGIWSFTKVFFFVNLALGFVIGVLYAMFFGFLMTLISAVGMNSDELGIETMSVGVLFFILPIFFALLSAVINTFIGVMILLVYNLMARAVGGLELTFEPVVTPWQQPAVAPGPQYAQQPPQRPMGTGPSDFTPPTVDRQERPNPDMPGPQQG